MSFPRAFRFQKAGIILTIAFFLFAQLPAICAEPETLLPTPETTESKEKPADKKSDNKSTTTADENKPAVTGENKPAAPAINEGGSAPASDGKISIDFTDVELPEVFKVLSSLSGANFVTSEEASKKKVSLLLDNVAFEDALKAITQGNGLVAQQVGTEKIYIVRLATAEETQVPLETRIFKLQYIRATSAKEVAVSETTTSGTSSIASSSGSSAVGGSTSGTGATTLSGGQEGEIKKTIEDLLSPRGKITVNDRNNSLVITDIAERLDQIDKVIKTLDHPIDQVLIEVIILETSFQFNRFLGTEWGTATTVGDASLGSVSGARGNFSIPFINQAADIVDRGSLFEEDSGLSFGAFDFSQMQATLKALQTDTRTKILAKPKILVLDNEPAFIKITTNTTIGKNTQVASGGTGGNLSSETAERTETGVSLKVSPLINDDNTLTLLLEPRFVTAAASTLFSTTFFDPSVRTARTTLTVKSGQMIVIGGLIQNNDTKIKRKVPLLGDIPLFGVFFTKWTTQKNNTELIIFMRPHIVKNSNLVRATSVPDKMTTIDEEAAEFWKVWEKPWFKKTKENASSINEEVDTFFEKRDQAIDKAMTFETAKRSSVKSKPEQKDEKANPPAEKKLKKHEKKETTASPLKLTKKEPNPTPQSVLKNPKPNQVTAPSSVPVNLA